MKKQLFFLLLSGSILLTGCASTTMIQSNPSGAKVYLNGEPVGVTPYEHRDRKIVGTKTIVKLEKEGYESFNTYFHRAEKVDVGALIGGIFVDFPFLWIMKYKPTHAYELKPVSANQPAAAITPQ
jgi:hypothetical protein